MTIDLIEKRIAELEKEYEKSVENLKQLEIKYAVENEHRVGVLASINELKNLTGGEENDEQ